MNSANVLYWPSAQKAAPVPPVTVVQGFNLAETLAYPFVGLELRAFIELRQLCESQARATGDDSVVVSAADLCSLCTALDQRPPSRSWAVLVMKFLQEANVIERLPRAGRPNAWRIRPPTAWLEPAHWTDLRRQVYRTGQTGRTGKPARTKTKITRMNNVVVRVDQWSRPNDAIADPLQGLAAQIYKEVFQREATIDFAARFLAQITDEPDVQVWRKLLLWYRFRYQKGNRTPNPRTLWEMFQDWRANPHRILEMPEPTLGQNAKGASDENNLRNSRNSQAAADALGLFNDSTDAEGASNLGAAARES